MPILIKGLGNSSFAKRLKRSTFALWVFQGPTDIFLPPTNTQLQGQDVNNSDYARFFWITWTMCKQRSPRKRLEQPFNMGGWVVMV